MAERTRSASIVCVSPLAVFTVSFTDVFPISAFSSFVCVRMFIPRFL